MAKRKSKAFAVTTVTGVTTVFDELYAREQRVLEQAPLNARASRTLNLGGDSGDSLNSSLEEPIKTSSLPVTTSPKTGGDRGGDGGDTPPVSPVETEALELPLAFWADLPRPSSIRVRTASGRTAWLTASRRRLSEAAAVHVAAFGPNEYEAALAAIVVARATPARLDAWIDRKAATPEWRLSAYEAMAGAVGFLTEMHPRKAVHVRAELLDVAIGAALERARCVVLEVVVEDVIAPSSAASTGEEFARL